MGNKFQSMTSRSVQQQSISAYNKHLQLSVKANFEAADKMQK